MRRLFVWGYNGLRFFDVRQGLPLLPVRPPFWFYTSYSPTASSNVRSCCVSPDARKMALSYTYNSPQPIFIRDIDSLDISTDFVAFQGAVQAVVSTNTHVAVCGAGGLYLYDWATMNVRRMDDGAPGNVLSACFSPDGSRIVACSDTMPRMWMWDIDTGESTICNSSTPPGSGRPACQFTKDGRFILTVSSDNNRTAIYDGTTLEQVWVSEQAAYKGGIHTRMQAHPRKDTTIIVGERFGVKGIYAIDCETHERTVIDNMHNSPFFAYSRATDEIYHVVASTMNDSISTTNVSDEISIRVFDGLTYEHKRDEKILADTDNLRYHLSSGWQDMQFIERGIHQITGTVRDINNSPCARTVRAFRRSDGVCMAQTESDATTGDYRLILPDAGPYDVQFQALDGENLNDLFFARSEPEPIEV